MSDLSIGKRITPFLSLWLKQYSALFYKSSVLLVRQRWTTVCVVLLPLAGLLLLWLAWSVAIPKNASPNYEPYSYPFTACHSLDVDGNSVTGECISVLFTPLTAQTERIMRDVAGRVNLQYGRDVQSLPDNVEFTDYISTHLGGVDATLVFNNALYSNQVNYTMYYNASSYLPVSTSYYWESYADYDTHNTAFMRFQNLQFHLEQAIADDIAMTVAFKYPNPNLDADVSPQPQSLLNGQSPLQYQNIPTLTDASMVSNSGGSPLPSRTDYVLAYGTIFAMVIPGAIITLVLMQLVSREKQGKLLGVLRVNGMHDSAYWTATLSAFIILTFLAALLESLIALALPLQTFEHTAFGIFFMTFWLFLLAMCSIGLFCSSFLTQAKWINLLSFFVFALAVLCGAIFRGDSSIYKLYNRNTSAASYVVLSALPWVPAGKLLADIYMHSTIQLVANSTMVQQWLNQSNHQAYSYPALSTLQIQQQQSYSWSQIYDQQLVVTDTNQCLQFDSVCCTYKSSKSCFFTDSSSYTMCILLIDTIVYSVMAWYLCSTCTKEQGGGRPFYFPFTRQFWGISLKEMAEEGDTLREQQIASENEQSIRTVKLTKTFKQTTAVKEVTLQMKPGEVSVVLGHNGAGKSTLLSILSGLQLPTFGDAFVCGQSVRSAAQSIQSLCGSCAQDNLLYESLTCYEHLKLFGMLRDVPLAQLHETILQRLRDVHLEDAQHKYSQHLSGGMKRRLMIAIAMIGTPKVLFLDEPTTGMDVLNRNKIWNSIRLLKRDRVVVLTTHSMDEADALGDVIALISNGKLRALGSSLFLKNKYGRGYNMNLLLHDDTQTDAFARLIKQFLPHAEFLATTGGHITIALKRAALKGLPEFFRFLEQSQLSALLQHQKQQHHQHQQNKQKLRKTEKAEPTECESEAVSDSMQLVPGTNSTDSTMISKNTEAFLVDEWSISNSTLEEVFLRLCAAEKGVNVDLIDDRSGDDSNDFQHHETQSSERLCLLCKRRAAETVTAFTADGVAFVVTNVICGPCSRNANDEKAAAEKEQAKAAEEKMREEQEEAAPVVLTLHDERHYHANKQEKGTPTMHANGNESLPAEINADTSSPHIALEMTNMVRDLNNGDDVAGEFKRDTERANTISMASSRNETAAEAVKQLTISDGHGTVTGSSNGGNSSGRESMALLTAPLASSAASASHPFTELSHALPGSEEMKSTRARQILAILVKNISLMTVERKGWIARVLVILVAAIIFVIFSLTNKANGSSTCPNGMVTKRIQDYYGMGPKSCDAADIKSYLFSERYYGYGGDFQTISLDYIDTGIEKPDQYPASMEPLFYFYAQNPSVNNDSKSRVWFLDTFLNNNADGSNTPFAQFNIGWGKSMATQVYQLNGQPKPVVSNLPSYQDSYPVYATRFVDVQNYGSTISNIVYAKQQWLASVSQGTLAQQCGYYYDTNPTRVVLVNSTSEANALLAGAYPDIGVEFLVTRLGSVDSTSQKYVKGEFAYKLVFIDPAVIPRYSSGLVPSVYVRLYGYCQQALIPSARGPLFSFAAFQHSLANAYLWTTINHTADMAALFRDLSAISPASTFAQNAGAPKIIGSFRVLAPVQFVSSASVTQYVVAVAILSFSTILILPWFADRIIYERETQLFHMQRLSGLKASTYWAGNYLSDSLLLWLWSFFFLIIGYALGLTGFQNTNGGVWILVFLIWNHVQICLAWCISAFFQSQRLANLFSYVAVVVIVVYGALTQLFLSVEQLPSGLIYFPPFAYIRLLSLIVQYGGNSLSIGPNGGNIAAGFSETLGILFLMGSLLGLVGWYLNTIRYRSPLFFLEDFFPSLMELRTGGSPGAYLRSKAIALIRRGPADTKQTDGSKAIDASLLQTGNDDERPTQINVSAAVDPDVLRERERALSNFKAGGDKVSPVTVLDLVKTYPAHGAVPEKCAVAGVHLGLEYGECFGLLGPNGAGKSTLINVLSGLLKPTSGQVLICGYDVVTQLEGVYSVLGICPQFDCVWPDLTVRQHLQFYARIKGCPMSKLRGLVQRVAELVELDGDSFDKRASTLSGGTRRRLSIAVSLIGNPRVWLLDEPSTGLSVEARRDIAEIINKQKRLGRAVLMTTHLMSEAETLSDRIGIVCAGQLQCIGTQAHLKAKFGHGFKLTFQLAFECESPQAEHVQKLEQLKKFVAAEVWQGAVIAVEATRGKNIFFAQPRKQITQTQTKQSEQNQHQNSTEQNDERKAQPWQQNENDKHTEQQSSGLMQLNDILALFNRLEQSKAALQSFGVTEYGLCQPSLEEVFIGIVKRTEAE